MIIGILGGGQLGRMLALEARRCGIRCVVRTDEVPGGPAAQVADAEVVGDYNNIELNQQFVNQVDCVTAEFENLPADLLRFFEQTVPVHPSSSSISVCQHREREKLFLRAHTIPHAGFRVVTTAAEAIDACASFDTKVVMKTSAFGYDGKGQVVLLPGANAGVAFDQLGVDRAVVERWVGYSCEISVVGARGVDGSWVAFAAAENVHVNGVLDITISPARIDDDVAIRAEHIARRLAEALDYVGVLSVEMFVMPDGSLLVNEMAPRPHNSGHHTIDSCETSQFGLQLSATLGLRLQPTKQTTKAAMVNLLGDLWENGEPDWALIDHPSVHLHLYGKATARPGRKMGHLTVVGPSTEQNLQIATSLRTALDTRQPR